MREKAKTAMRLAMLTAGLVLLGSAVAGILYTRGEADGEVPESVRFLASSTALEREASELVARDGPEALPRAEELLREAVRRDPSSAYRWAALGESYLAAERPDAARLCMTRAAELGPNVAPILIRAANFHFAMDERDAAMRYGRHILALIPDYDAVVFALYARMDIPVAQVLASGIAPTSRAGASYFRNLLGRPRAGDQEVVWKWLGARGWTGDTLASAYVDQLLARQDYPGALRTWAAYLGQRRGHYPDGNRVFNGGFETEFTPAALDWKQRAADGASCLRVDFLGQTNVAFDHVSQTVVVEPGVYRFRAFVKTRDITTDQGVRFRIADALAPARLEVITEGFTLTHDWTEVEQLVRLGAATHLVTVQVVRQASMKFDNKIRGTAWVDDVTLEPWR
jgi:tetratricopeptide (TPR) repeat protein